MLPVLFAFMTERDHGFLFGWKGSSPATYLIVRRLPAAIAEMVSEEIAASRLYRHVKANSIRFMSARIFSELEAWHHDGGSRPIGDVVKDLDNLVLPLLTA